MFFLFLVYEKHKKKHIFLICELKCVSFRELMCVMKEGIVSFLGI